MKHSASVKVNGVERELPFAMIGAEEIIGSALGLVKDPGAFVVSYKIGDREGRVLPSERMVPEDGMEFTVSPR